MSRDPIVDVATGRRLRVARLALGLAEAEAAKECDVSLRTYRRWEEHFPLGSQYSNLFWLFHKHGVTLTWILCGDGRDLDSHLTKNRWGKVAILPLSARR